MTSTVVNYGDLITTGNTFIGADCVCGSNLSVNGSIFSLYQAGVSLNYPQPGVASPTYIGSTQYPFNKIFVNTLNISTLNVTSLFGQTGSIGVGTTDPHGTTLYVDGNVTFTNAITTINVFSTTANILTVNTANFTSSSGFLGVGAPVNTTTTLYVNGNIYVSNSLTTTNVLASGTLNVQSANVVSLTSSTIYYEEDLTKRGPYLTPSPSNAAIIQSWISSTINAASQPSQSWWATSPTPTFAIAATTGLPPPAEYNSSILIPDGRVLSVGSDYQNITLFNPYTYTFTNSRLGATSGIYFKSAVLCPDGNIALIPQTIQPTANLVIFNPISSIISSNAVINNSGRLSGIGVLGPTGNVIIAPSSASSNITIFNPITRKFSNVGPISGPPTSWDGGTLLLPDGNVIFGSLLTKQAGMYNSYCVSETSLGGNFTRITTPNFINSLCLSSRGAAIGFCYEINLYEGTIISINTKTFQVSSVSTGELACNGGCLLPSGNVICVSGPSDSKELSMINPDNLTFCQLPYTSSMISAGNATLLPDGRVVTAPDNNGNIGILNTMVPVDPAFCLSPYFNKF